ncbi:hypothetical protein KJ567_00475 [Candidatus Bipolaricaulota bacterium]|nr:hypothetical protein [Candidatus Bipolaricaulota bacterium]
MKIAKLALTVALLLFVGATVSMLVAQEVSHPAVTKTEDVSLPDGAAPEAHAPAVETQAAPPDVASDDVPPTVAEVTAEPASIADATPASVCVVDAIYFHNTARCRTCKNIEATAKAVLEAAFAEELAEGRLRWSTINMEQERHYVEEYDLVKPTLILARSVDDEPQDWVALDEAWSLIGRDARFSAYVEDSTRAFLEGCP